MDIQTLSARFGVNAERRTDGGFPVFENNIAGKRVLLVADETTEQFLPRIEGIVKANAAACTSLVLPSPEPVADEESVSLVANQRPLQVCRFSYAYPERRVCHRSLDGRLYLGRDAPH